MACIFALSCGLCHSSPLNTRIPIEIFPLQHYDQNVDTWLNPNAPDYNKPLVERHYQKTRLKDFYNHLYSTDKDAKSPWTPNCLSRYLNNQEILNIQKYWVKFFDNRYNNGNKIGFGPNFRPYDKTWIDNITLNMDLDQFKKINGFKNENRAILVNNTFLRALPTHDPIYYHFSLPGEGYPFDRLQMSNLWIGTPLYIIGQSKDKNWFFVSNGDIFGWVESDAIAIVDDAFIACWQKTAKKNMLAITKTETLVKFSSRKNNDVFKTYVGTVFPLQAKGYDYYKILFPIKHTDGKAKITKAYIKKSDAALMPLVATPQNFSKLIKTLQGRPYGWGGYNFYNDCSLELKYLFTPFGFWLPRHSATQQDAGKTVDISEKTVAERLKYLKENTLPMMTIISYQGHVLMYLGHHANPHDQNEPAVAMTYQSMWGLHSQDESKRYVIGQTVLFPLLKTFPEEPTINPQCNAASFKIIHLDQWPSIKQSQGL